MLAFLCVNCGSVPAQLCNLALLICAQLLKQFQKVSKMAVFAK